MEVNNDEMKISIGLTAKNSEAVATELSKILALVDVTMA